MQTRRLNSALLLSTVLASGVLVPSLAHAQAPAMAPPVFKTIDENHVDLGTDNLVLTYASVAIGPGGPGSLGYNWVSDPSGQRPEISGYISFPTFSGTLYLVLGGSTETFTYSGTPTAAVFTQD